MKFFRFFVKTIICTLLLFQIGTGEAFSQEVEGAPTASALTVSVLNIDYESLVHDINAFRTQNGLDGLSFNRRLQAAARMHAIDMVNRLYYDHADPDGLYPQDRMRSKGYIPIFWGESMGAVAFNGWINPTDAIDIILDSLVESANKRGKEDAPILSPLLEEVGIYAVAAQIELFRPWKYVYVLVMDFGTEMHSFCSTTGEDENMTFKVAGHVYRDENGNGRFDFSEGVPGVDIKITGPLGIYGPTDPSFWVEGVFNGEFNLVLRPGMYRVDVFKDNVFLTTTIFSLYENRCPVELFIPLF